MNRKIRKLTAGLLAFAMLFAVFAARPMAAFAATGQITFSDPTATVGNQVTVSMRISSDSALGASDVMLNYDSSALEFVSGTNANGGAGSIRVVGSMEEANQTDFRFTLTFRALKAGTSSISVASYEVYDADSQTVSLSHVGTSAVQVSAPSTYSSDASLSSLTVSPGELSPAFSPDVTEYSVTVPGDVDRLTISAPATDDGATVSINGNENLQMGENTVTCQVTAEDGETTRTYTLTVTKTDEASSEDGTETSVDAGAVGSGVQVTVDEGTWQVAESFDAAALPSGFTQTEITYDGTQVQAGTDGNGTILLYMTDENGNGDFFVYDEEQGILSPYVTIEVSEKSIVVLPPERLPEGMELPDGFVECTIDIGTHTVHGWIWESSEGETPEYCVVYGMNEDGEENLYRYDQKEMTVQRYFQDPAAEEIRNRYVQVAEDYNSLLEDYNIRGYLVAGLFGVSILLVIVLVILLMTRKPKGPRDGGYQEESTGRGPEGPKSSGRPAANRRTADRNQEKAAGDPQGAEDAAPVRKSGAGNKSSAAKNGRREAAGSRKDAADSWKEASGRQEEASGDWKDTVTEPEMPKGKKGISAQKDAADELEILDLDFDAPAPEEPNTGKERLRNFLREEEAVSRETAKRETAAAGEDSADDDLEFIDLD